MMNEALTNTERESINHLQGKPCYCGALVGSLCDFCSGLAAPDGARWEDALKDAVEQAQ